MPGEPGWCLRPSQCGGLCPSTVVLGVELCHGGLGWGSRPSLVDWVREGEGDQGSLVSADIPPFMLSPRLHWRDAGAPGPGGGGLGPWELGAHGCLCPGIPRGS